MRCGTRFARSGKSDFINKLIIHISFRKMEEIFNRLSITGNTTRCKATRNKKALNELPDNDGFYMCAICFQAFEQHCELDDHIHDVHRAQASVIKEEYRQACEKLQLNPTSEVCKHNKKLATLKLTCLEHIGRRGGARSATGRRRQVRPSS
jgi:uncharacterized protein (DUF885 family)